MEQRKPRQACFDRMRVIAIIGVIIGSVSELLVNWEAAGGQALGFTWHLANLFGSATRFAIPLLLMSVGAILLEKEESASLKEVLYRRVLMLLIPLAVWTLLYLVFNFLWHDMLGAAFSFTDSLKWLLHTPAASHLWLFYLLLALYLVLPFLRLLVQHAPRALIVYGVGLWFVFSSVWPTLSGLFPNLSLPVFGRVEVLGGYLGYLLLGWLLMAEKSMPRVRGAVIGYALCVAFTTVVTALMTKGAGEANLVLYQAMMPNVVLMTVCMFLVCRSVERQTVFSPWLSAMAQFAFGMYAIYEVYTLLLTPLLRMIPGILSLLLAPLLIWILSMVSVAFMRRLRIVRLLLLGER